MNLKLEYFCIMPEELALGIPEEVTDSDRPTESKQEQPMLPKVIWSTEIVQAGSE